MKNKGLIIAAAVLAGLLGFLYWSNKHKPADSPVGLPTPTPAEPAPQILSLNEADITKVELKKKVGDTIVLTRDSSGKWQITAPKTIGADEAAVSGILSSIASLKSDRLIEEKAANPGRYGLAEPRLELTITDKSNVTRKLLVGDDTPVGNGAYVQLSGDPRVFTVASYVKTSVDKSLNDLRDKRLMTADADKITRLELSLKGQNVEFSRDKQQWQILKPQPLRADATAVDELVRKLTEARMDTAATEQGPKPEATPTPGAAAKKDEAKKSDTTPEAAFASGSLVAIAKVTTDSGMQQLEVRKNKDNYYARSSVTEGVYKVANDLGTALDKKLADFRNKKVFDFGVDDPKKIEIQDGGKSYSISKNGADWAFGEGKKYDKAGVDAIVNKLRGLEATEFNDSGFGSAALQISVTSSDGKRVERVSLSKGAKNTFAKREGESSLYVLDENAVADLQKLLSDLKGQ